MRTHLSLHGLEIPSLLCDLRNVSLVGESDLSSF